MFKFTKLFTLLLLLDISCAFALDTPTEDFIDNNDGTVTHSKTGLTWQRCAVGQTWTGLTCSGVPSIFAWDSASKLTSNFAGKTDWHVPRIDELKSIIEHSSYSPALNKTIFPNSTTSAIYIFWSASSFISDVQNNLKWSASLQHGDLLSEAKSLSRAVRLVSGTSVLSTLGEYTSTNDFIDNKDGTVFHKKTGLMWQRCAVGQTWTGSTCSGTATTMHHLEATQQKSNFSSYSDWRLPTINELSSIVEYKNYSASINKSIFPNAVSTWFWTMSDDFVSPSAASWIVDFINGTEGSYLHGYDYAVRLVRTATYPKDTPTEDFIDNKDGTVTHKKTGLTWQRCSVGQTWTGSVCSGDPSTFTWDAASKLTSNYSGKGDWRLPRIDELGSIVERNSFNPSINSTVFPNTNMNTFAYWSSSLFGGDPNAGAWRVSFYQGDSDIEGRYQVRTVRFVRGGTPLASSGEFTPSVDFIDNSNGSVTHTKTGLTWQRCAVGQNWNGSGCLGNATSLTRDLAINQSNLLGGYNDWRLPTLVELKSIVEYKNYSPTINTSIFSNSSSKFWTATKMAAEPSYLWMVDFARGSDTVGTGDSSYSFPVRLVRGTWTASTSTPIVSTTFDLSAMLSQPTSRIQQNSSIIYTGTVKNNGTDSANTVQLKFYLPPRNVSIISIPSDCSVTGKSITCSLGNLAANESVNRSITVSYTKSGGSSISALVLTDSGDTNSANNVSRIVTAITK